MFINTLNIIYINYTLFVTSLLMRPYESVETCQSDIILPDIMYPFKKMGNINVFSYFTLSNIRYFGIYKNYILCYDQKLFILLINGPHILIFRTV